MKWKYKVLTNSNFYVHLFDKIQFIIVTTQRMEEKKAAVSCFEPDKWTWTNRLFASTLWRVAELNCGPGASFPELREARWYK